jgi:hypothetical protein
MALLETNFCYAFWRRVALNHPASTEKPQSAGWGFFVSASPFQANAKKI